MIKKILLQLANKSSVMARSKQWYQTKRNGYYASLPIDDKLIVFEAFRSTKYTDSPKAIYEYMLSNHAYDDYRFIWIFEDVNHYKFVQNDRTTVVQHESHDYYKAFATAKYWVVNGWVPLRVKKKPTQIALQCWHGTPLKRLRYDIVTSQMTNHKRNALRENDEDMKRYDYLISPSKFATAAFSSAFNLPALSKQDIIIETGYPRNDVLVNSTEEDVKRYREKFSIADDKKIILYAPTWRDDQHIEGKGYEYSMPVDFELLQQKLSDDYVLLFRAHGLVANQFDFAKYGGFVRDVSKADDINELYIAADVLMTDYSSVFFDYANLRRPIIFYMYDLEHYEKDLRGFYIDLKELPGDIVRTENEVVDILSDLGAYQKKHATKQQSFYDTYNYLDDGKATKRVVETVIKSDKT